MMGARCHPLTGAGVSGVRLSDKLVNLVYFGELVLGIWEKNLFCNGLPRWAGLATLAKHIFLWVNPYFEVHQGSPSSPTAIFSYSFNNLVNLVYFSVLLCVYGKLFALWFLGAGLVYFSAGIEVHQCTSGSLTGGQLFETEAEMEFCMAFVAAALILGAIRLAGEWRNL